MPVRRLRDGHLTAAADHHPARTGATHGSVRPLAHASSREVPRSRYMRAHVSRGLARATHGRVDVVREGGLEPPRPCGHRNLNPARLPIPPLARERRRIAQTSQYDRWPMGLQRFERRLERLVEGGFGKAFRTGLQPVEIGRRLVRELDSGRSLGVRGTVAPNQFTVRISEDDEARFAGFRDALVAELTETVRDSARASNYRFVGPVEVRMAVDPRFGVGDLAVDAAIVASPDGLTGALVMPDGRRI